jgi:protein-tyrosine phosphatase
MICTGNQCRSPMAEAVLRARFARAGLDVRVTSAGLVSDGVPASRGAVRAMHQRGLDLGAHLSSPLTAERVHSADLIVGMAREHVREAVVLDPSALSRTFTLRELVRRGAVVGPRVDEPLGPWLDRLGAGRRPGDLLGPDTSDDIPDPIGRSRRVYERTATEIEELVDHFVRLAFPAGLRTPAQ